MKSHDVFPLPIRICVQTVRPTKYYITYAAFGLKIDLPSSLFSGILLVLCLI
jgi:hypothetical protein